MPAVKALAKISDKWARVAAVSQPEYQDGIQNPRKDWAAEAAKAEDAYKKGVQAAMSRGAYGKGVRAAGTVKWKKNSLEKGSDRWVQGISLSREAYEKGFAPYRQVIEGITLPARGPKGDPSNIQRVAVLAKALHEAKVNK